MRVPFPHLLHLPNHLCRRLAECIQALFVQSSLFHGPVVWNLVEVQDHRRPCVFDCGMESVDLNWRRIRKDQGVQLAKCNLPIQTLRVDHFLCHAEGVVDVKISYISGASSMRKNNSSRDDLREPLLCEFSQDGAVVNL